MSTSDGASAQARPERARLRRAPRFGVFFALGAALGVIAAMVLSLTWSGGAATPEASASGLEYSQAQVFGFALVYLVPIGVALGGVTAVVIDAVSSRRAREIEVGHESGLAGDGGA